MKFYVLRLVDWLPIAVRQTNQPKHIKPFLLRMTYTIFSSNLHNKLFKTRTRTPSAEIITSRTLFSGDNNFTDAGLLVRCHDNEVTL
jgi:hypothetical protein